MGSHHRDPGHHRSVHLPSPHRLVDGQQCGPGLYWVQRSHGPLGGGGHDLLDPSKGVQAMIKRIRQAWRDITEAAFDTGYEPYDVIPPGEEVTR